MVFEPMSSAVVVVLPALTVGRLRLKQAPTIAGAGGDDRPGQQAPWDFAAVGFHKFSVCMLRRLRQSQPLGLTVAGRIPDREHRLLEDILGRPLGDCGEAGGSR